MFERLGKKILLPPAYVVRREGNSFTLLVCPQLGGVSQPGGGQPAGGGSASRGGISQPGGGQPAGGVGQSAGGVSQPGGVSQLGGGGSAKIGQQNEYSLHGGRYASCVHAGGLSCLIYNSKSL